MAGIGHNGGPEVEGLAWRTHCWKAARQKLLPVLPVEVVRLRVRRAQALGLDYKTYAGVRSTTGRDIVAFLFSSNALGRNGTIAAQNAQKLIQIAGAATRQGLVQGGDLGAFLQASANLLDGASLAPRPFADFASTRAALRQAMDLADGRRLAGDQVVLISSDAPWEREWLSAGKLAAMVPATSYFGA